MRFILAGLVVCGACGAWTAAVGQFAGKLTYKVVRANNETLTMVYYQNGNSARIDARTMSADSSQVINTQDTLLFDIAARKETHLQYKTGFAYIMPNTGNSAVGAMANSTLSVVTVGGETVNGYACTHYTLVNQTGRLTTKRELWITTSLGNPSVQVIAPYLYYTAEWPPAVKLAAAGATGVVVKSSFTAPGLSTVMNLVAVDTKRLAPATFQVPARYSVVDRTQ